MENETDRPSLEAARQFTRDLGPAAMAGGALICMLALVLPALQSPFADYFVLPLGLVILLFGTAAFVRTDTATGKVLRWLVVGTLAGGGILSLYHWAILIWGAREVGVQGDLTVYGLYLFAGPTLLVPAGLAAVRPGWVPLIVTPAIVALTSAAVVGYGTLLFLALPDSPLTDVTIMSGVILANLAVFVYSGHRGLTIARQQGWQMRS